MISLLFPCTSCLPRCTVIHLLTLVSSWYHCLFLIFHVHRIGLTPQMEMRSKYSIIFIILSNNNMKIILSLFVLHVVRKACAGGRERPHFYGKPAKSLSKLGSRRFNTFRFLVFFSKVFSLCFLGKNSSSLSSFIFF